MRKIAYDFELVCKSDCRLRNYVNMIDAIDS